MPYPLYVVFKVGRLLI